MTTDNEQQRRALVAKAAALVPLLKASAPKAEEARRIPDETLAAMDAAGLFRLRAPRRFGGDEADLRSYVDVVAELGRGCGSTAWIAFISNATAWIAALFPDAVQRELFDGRPDARFIGLLEPSAQTKPADGGYVVNGRWGFASNCLHAHWGLLAVPLMAADGSVVDQAVALMPVDNLSIEDTWRVVGMRATGSNTVIAKDVLVPTRRILSLGRLVTNTPPREQTDEVVYREDFILTAILMVVPPILGMAQGALDQTLAALSKGKKIYYTFYADARSAPSTQMRVAEAAGLIDTGFALVRHWADRICAAAREGTAFDAGTRAQARMAFGNAVVCCRKAVDILMNVNGAGAFADGNPMQRIWRDFEMASRHALISPDIAQELYSRALLGIEEPITPMA